MVFNFKSIGSFFDYKLSIYEPLLDIIYTLKEELNAESFIKLVSKYTDIKELDPEIIRTFVDKIYVKRSEKIPGSKIKKQTIWIYWNFIRKVTFKNRHKG